MKFLKRFNKPNLSSIKAKLSQFRLSAATRLKSQLTSLKKLKKYRPKRLPRLPEAKSWVQNRWDTLQRNIPKSFDELKQMQSFETLQKIRQLASEKSYGTYIKLGAATFAAYFMADTVSLFTDALIPDPPPVPAPRVSNRQKQDPFEKYQSIITRQIFNSKGLIPEDDANLATGPARKSTLPFQLVGTVVLKDEFKSIAAIEDQTESLVFPVRIDDTISEKATITKIEHLKVFFINKQSGHLEYIEIIDDLKSMPSRVTPTSNVTEPKSEGKGIVQNSPTNFRVERSLIDETMPNLGEVLQQARAIPNFQNGKLDGYKLIQIIPGSVYDKLGLKNYDVVCGVNGAQITNPGQAFEIFNQLKDLSHLELCVKRGGRTMTMNYDID